MRVAPCARVFTERQAERGTIGSQLERSRSHMAAAGHEPVGEYVDDGHSGGWLDRHGLAESGLFEQVSCLSRDRLARAYAYQVLVLDELAGSASLTSVRNSTASSSPTGSVRAGRCCSTRSAGTTRSRTG
jgi:DNA invertase Pin-like site-specific DNA recombinase